MNGLLQTSKFARPNFIPVATYAGSHTTTIQVYYLTEI